MNEYTIHCTKEQTEKALELGAPVVLSEKRDVYNDYPQEIPGKIGKYFTFEESYSCCFCNNYGAYIIPTAEQMLGWLEENFVSEIDIYKEGTSFRFDIFSFNMKYIKGHSGYNTRKEATLAAINAALDYLIDKK